MHSTSLFLSSFLLIFVIVVLNSHSVNALTCKEIVSSLTKRQMAGMTRCAKGMTFKNKKDKSAKSNCILKCVMAAEGLLSEDGQMSKESFDAFLVKEQMPPDMKVQALNTMGVCREKHASALDNTEEYCQSYDPLIKCLMGAFLKLCP